jgi:hypothetical protein
MKIVTGLGVAFVMLAGAAQVIATAEEKKGGPAANPAAAARPAAPAARPAAPVARPAAPVARPAAPIAQPAAPAARPPAVAQPTGPARQAPVVRQTPPGQTAPSVPAIVQSPNAPAQVVTPGARTASPNAAPNNRGTVGFGAAGRMPGSVSVSPIRGARSATIAGQNFTIWRGSHRSLHDGRWRTFVGLGALSAVLVGASYYYPYAYIDASYDFCRGWTDDGCELRWEAVPTVEGPTDYQCVAYCPWR